MRIEEKFIEIKEEGKYYDRLEYLVCDSGKKGPKIFITSGAHGEEIGGMFVVYRLFERLKGTSLNNGAVYAIPNMNPNGIIRLSHRLVPSREDLNRCFPGNPYGTIGKRIANSIFKEILMIKPDFVFDLHNDWRLSMPYAILEPDSGDLMNNEAYKISEEKIYSTGLLVVREKEKIKGSLSLSLLEADIPSATLELGESYVVNHNNVEYGVKSILNFLTDMRMINAKEKIRYVSNEVMSLKKSKTICNYYDLPHTKDDGILEHLVEPGERVKIGQEIACLIGKFGKVVSSFSAEREGIVLSRRGDSVIRKGSPVMAFGVYP